MEFELIETLKGGNDFNYKLTYHGAVVGLSQIRIQPSKNEDMPDGFESNIGYEIVPEFQGRGFGKELFKLALEKTFELGLNEPIVTCGNGNLRSKKIIESAGGILLEQKADKKGDLMNKYTFNK
ncbi:MAG: GNAT family N-acetyltransferase [Candidatus Pacebacteria bacterium]|nr:GNAT family N-acetyltransferase [Candidatus Paceibacterota bacterium]